MLVAFAAAVGTAAALRYHQLGLTLTHYDARAHLVVARRIFDSVTPGWQQIGAVWLPLPHLLNAVPVQIDAFYRTGFFAIAISVLGLSLGAGAIGWIVARLTDSHWAAAVAAGVFVLNPNVLYLQSTPMTEPLLMALTLLAVAILMAWCDDQNRTRGETTERETMRRPDGHVSVAMVGWAFALACMTRYEAWPVTAAALIGAIWVRWRQTSPLGQAIRDVIPIALYPALSIVAFTVFSRIVTGAWFASDFFVPENTAKGHPYDALAEVAWGVRALSGYG